MNTFLGANEWPGAVEFLEALAALAQHPSPDVRGLFAADARVSIARAPGRLDLMGGIADYSGSLVLQLPISEAAWVAVQRCPEARVRVVTLDVATGKARTFGIQTSELVNGELASYGGARAYFAEHPEHSWAGYVIGVTLTLLRETSHTIEGGLSLLVFSQVPEGKGVSSSAALEVASLMAVLGALGQTLPPKQLALLCQKAENLVVGAPCGIMDQMASALGKRGQLLELLCQPAEVLGHVKLPTELRVWGIDSGVRHAVSGADYGQVRAAAFMGQRILGTGDYLANLEPAEFLQRHATRLPTSLLGRDFLRDHGDTQDALSNIDPERSYPIAAATAHPILEHARVNRFRSLLTQPTVDASTGAQLGELMFASHASYSACGLGSRNTDLLVELVRQAGPAEGLLGAKITGGGSGGTVAVLGARGSERAIAEVLKAYERETGITSHLFQGSSPGAVEFGVRELSSP